MPLPAGAESWAQGEGESPTDPAGPGLCRAAGTQLTLQTYLMNSSAGLLSGRWEPGSAGNMSEGSVAWREPVTFFWIFWVMVKKLWVSSLET